MTGATHVILYISNQDASRRFYSHVLGLEPRLDVRGMTEFDLPGGAVLGLMPEVRGTHGYVLFFGRPIDD